MDPMVAASLISAGSNLAGGLMGRSSAQDQANKNMQMQLAFAKKGIQWRVADAQKAGVHPLAALGASMQGYSPVSLGDPLPGALSEMGQNLGRAVAATGTAGQRVMQGLTIENMQLQNDFLRARIGAIQKDQVGPPVPTHSTAGGQMSPIGAISGLPWSGAPGWSEFPSEATVSAPSGKVQGVKAGGYNLIRNPAQYSAAQDLQNEFGEMAENVGLIGMFKAWVDAMERDGYLAAPKGSREYIWANTMRRAREAAARRSRPWGE